MGLNEQLVFKDPTYFLPAQTHPFDTSNIIYIKDYKTVAFDI
jgi:hypothetical protein